MVIMSDGRERLTRTRIVIGLLVSAVLLPLAINILTSRTSEMDVRWLWFAVPVTCCLIAILVAVELRAARQPVVPPIAPNPPSEDGPTDAPPSRRTPRAVSFSQNNRASGSAHQVNNQAVNMHFADERGTRQSSAGEDDAE